MQIIIFLGAPGAGKGTAAARLADKLPAKHISTGAMLREAVKNGTPAGLAAKSYMDAGGLVPDEVLIDMIGELLSASAEDQVFFFDGFPRNVKQAEALDALASKFDAKVCPAVCIDVPTEILLKRLGGRRVCPKCGACYHIETLKPKVDGVCDACQTELVIRNDDQPATIKHRLEVYEEQTAPLISWYTNAGKLCNVDGSADADTVAEAVMKVIK